MNSKQIGDITELTVMLAFVQAGYNILIPYGDREKYDFVADINNNFIRIQVKTSHSINNGESFEFSCKSSTTNNGKKTYVSYTKNDIDFYATIFNNQCYLIPVEECGSSAKRLRILPTKNNQCQGICWAKNFEIEKVLNNCFFV